MKKLFCMILAAAMVLAAGCSSGSEPASSAAPASGPALEPASSEEASEAAAGEPVELMVSAAASLTDCLTEMKALYEAENEGVTLTFNFGASGALQQQIEQGAPADVFFSAGKKQMTALSEAGLMNDATVKDILENKVVLIVPAGGEKIESFEALADTSITQIGVGEPSSVPVGQYTEEAFANLGLTDKLKDKLVFAKDVREVLSWVETQNVQAGIVYETDAKISDKVEICCAAPEGSHKKVIYPVGVTRDSTAPDAAKAFVDYLFGDEAKDLFVKYGFSPVS
ncbi:molybdate ABC transporter substrate-binding protein [Anaerotruncus rubiinfantis]|jgi:molybdate transport system substrate-binding protein|uniref:molybdate ABC transporter substrate-binding protein n=1 Tax=Anaerotruncus rubiinfantis TaxID=1720200 RepID=UPI0008368DF5|nr:molybdate ABC transporter substrate-binding protein [Anaerotruncus rubiinfantis]